jgi:glycosyltransferase involved in cell wall biosynthesis
MRNAHLPIMKGLTMNFQRHAIAQPQPLLTVVIPALEPDAELARCVHCILGAAQNSPQPEIIIVTQPLFVSAVAALFPGVRVCEETRRGIYSAMNDGAAASRGRYLYFIGKDDMMLSTLREAMIVLDRENPYALFCDVYWGERGTYSGKPSRLLLLGRNLCHQGIIYSREAFDRHGPYLRRMRVQADHLLNIKILWDRSAVTRIRYLDRPLAWYSGDGFSMRNRDAAFWRLYPIIMRRFVGGWAACLLNTYRWLRRVQRHGPKRT